MSFRTIYVWAFGVSFGATLLRATESGGVEWWALVPLTFALSLFFVWASRDWEER